MINLAQNFRNSLAGFGAAMNDRSFRAELLLGVILVPTVMGSSTSTGLKLTTLAIYLLLLALELFNTALEKLCDLVMPQQHPTIKAIKDMASAAVFLVLLVLLSLWAIVLMGIPEL